MSNDEKGRLNGFRLFDVDKDGLSPCVICGSTKVKVFSEYWYDTKGKHLENLTRHNVMQCVKCKIER